MSSPDAAMFENAVSQPARAVLTGEMSNPCSETANSTSDSKRHCARIGLGIRIPSEFPILMIDAFMDSQSNYRSGSSNSFHPIGGAGGRGIQRDFQGGPRGASRAGARRSQRMSRSEAISRNSVTLLQAVVPARLPWFFGESRLSFYDQTVKCDVTVHGCGIMFVTRFLCFGKTEHFV